MALKRLPNPKLVNLLSLKCKFNDASEVRYDKSQNIFPSLSFVIELLIRLISKDDREESLEILLKTLANPKLVNLLFQKFKINDEREVSNDKSQSIVSSPAFEIELFQRFIYKDVRDASVEILLKRLPTPKLVNLLYSKFKFNFES